MNIYLRNQWSMNIDKEQTIFHLSYKDKKNQLDLK
jgi:hypothetical protein